MPEFRGTACGRVNLIGDHTDYNGGFVLPTAIPQKTVVILEKTSGEEVQILSLGPAGEKMAASYVLGQEQRRNQWHDYLQGATWLLQAKGHALGGYSLQVHSTVPLGAGLSSSAALLVALFRALRAAFGIKCDDLQIARWSQEVENTFVQAAVGIMDPMAVSLCQPGVALFLDCRSIEYRQIALPTGCADIIVMNSGIKHSNVHGDYNRRRAECAEACAILGVNTLRDVEPHTDWQARLPPSLQRRVRHVLYENSRVCDAVRAIEDADMARLGELFQESHRSLRDDYEVSVPAVDQLVAMAAGQREVLGARMTGGGFGGSVVILTRQGTGDLVGRRILHEYERHSRRKSSMFVLRFD